MGHRFVYLLQARSYAEARKTDGNTKFGEDKFEEAEGFYSEVKKLTALRGAYLKPTAVRGDGRRFVWTRHLCTTAIVPLAAWLAPGNILL